jgi:hypothetical protein
MIKLLQKQTNVSARERKDARRQEDDVTLWRDYHTFLKAKMALLEVRIAESRTAFERADSRELEAEQAQAALDRIPAGIRAMFEAVLEERRQRVQAELEAEARSRGSGGRSRQLDPDIVDRRTLDELLAEAEGEVETDSTPKGYGWFPRGALGDIRWYALDVAELVAAPTAASYTVAAEQDDTRRRLIMAIAAGVFGVVFLFVWFALPRGTQTRDAAALAPLVSDGMTSATPVAMDVWPVQRVSITLNDGQRSTIAVAATTNATWPATTEMQQAYWQRNAFAPLKLCLAPDLMENLRSLQIAGGGSWPDRVYAISPNESSATSLVLEACRSNGSPRRYGVLQQTAPPTSYAIGKPVTLPGKNEEAITVRTIEIAGPGQDPMLPQGQARIVVVVDARLDLDWPAYAPTLLLPSGQAYLPAETVAHPNGAELRYLVPLPATDTPIAWDITVPGIGQTARWRATLAPPVNRVDILRGALEVLSVSAQEQNGAFDISITVTNKSKAPLRLTREDITLTQSDRRINTPDIGALTTPLAPGEQRTFAFSVPGGQQPLLLSIGTQSYRITP